MTKRQIPIGDPRIKGMNDTQWVFELEAMNREDSERYDDIRMMADVVKDQLVSMLGLNLCPVEDAGTGLLRMPREHEIMPLSVMIGRDDVLKMVKERHEELATQADVRSQLGPGAVNDSVVEMTPEELEEFMSDPGDVDFDNTPEELKKAMGWGDRATQAYLETVVLNKDDVEEGTLDARARTLGQARADIIASAGQKEASEEHDAHVPDIEVIPVEVLSDPAAEHVPPPEQRPLITLDSD